MKYLLLSVITCFVFVSFSTQAAELSKFTDHPNGWSFLFYTGTIKSAEFPEGHKYPIELPFNKCKPSDPKKECFATKGEAEHAAWVKAHKAEKMMKEALAK